MLRTASILLLSLFIVGSTATAPEPPTPPPCSESQTDIFFLLDQSDSVTQDNFNMVLDFVAEFATNFTLGNESVQVGVATFSFKVTPQIRLGQYQTTAELASAILAISYEGGMPLTDGALEYSRAVAFQPGKGGRLTSTKVVILVTDGKSLTAGRTMIEAKRLKEDSTLDARVFTVGIGGDVDRDELYMIASQPSNVFKVENFMALSNNLEYLVEDTCEAIGQVNGRWSDWSNFSECSTSCGGGMKTRSRTCTEPVPSNGGRNCTGPATQSKVCNPQSCTEVCQNGTADVFFLLDQSGSVGLVNFQVVKEFVKLFASSFRIDGKSVQMGVATFATSVYPQVTLQLALDLQAELDDILYTGGYTRTDLGLDYLREQAFLPANGARSGVPQFAIVITDGKSNNVNQTQIAASLLKKDSSITVFAVGVGDDVDFDELRLIASNDNYVVEVSDFEKLLNILPEINNELCSVDGVWGPWNTWGVCNQTCGTGYQTRSRDCLGSMITVGVGCVGEDTETRECNTVSCAEACKATVADVMFLLENTNSVEASGFGAQKSLVQSFAAANTIGRSNLQLGVIQHGQEAILKIGLTSSPDIESLNDAVDSIMYMSSDISQQGLNKALEQALTLAFSDGRPDAPDFIVLVTDGPATDPIGLQVQVNNLRSQAVTVFAIGVGGSVKPVELDNIAGDSGNVFRVDNFSDLFSLGMKLQERICALPVDGGWSEWGPWGECSLTCGEGTRIRTRTCTNPSPSGGGKGCTGSPTESGNCGKACYSDCPLTRADVLFLVDVSHSVGETQFRQSLNVAFRVNRLFDSGNSMRLSYAFFSTEVYTWVNFTESYTTRELYNKLDDTPYASGLRYTDQALKYVREEAFSTERGGRDNAPDIVILITNGESTSPRDTRTEAALLAETDIKVIVVGVGNVNIDELRFIASKPEYVIHAQSYRDLRAAYVNTLLYYCRIPPDSPSALCYFTANSEGGALSSVTLRCSTESNTHKAGCDFYRTVNYDGNAIAAEAPVQYTHVGNQDGWETTCNVTIPLEELGVGSNTFMVYIYSDVPDGRLYVSPKDFGVAIPLRLPRAVHSCPPELVDNFFCGLETVCTCDLVDGGYPAGQAFWFSQETRLQSSNLTISAANASGQYFTCKAVSPLGQVFGSSLKFTPQCG